MKKYELFRYTNALIYNEILIMVASIYKIIQLNFITI